MTRNEIITTIRHMINDSKLKEFDYEVLADLFNINTEHLDAWQVCSELTSVLMDLDLDDSTREKAKIKFMAMASNLAAFLCDEVI